MTEYITETYGIANGVIYTERHEEIVRCRDCRHYEKADYIEYNYDFCGLNIPHIIEPNGFCAWGERASE